MITLSKSYYKWIFAFQKINSDNVYLLTNSIRNCNMLLLLSWIKNIIFKEK